ncbi:MAG TPA: hypothetical protein VG125_26040, partial [Pirellulales bacterium]|nr:hypothetical protein [Pirellulales bacterium]
MNVATNDAGTAWDSHRRQSKYAHRNRDITRLVGSAISRVLYACAESPDHEQCRKWLQALAKVAGQKYEALAVCPSLGAIRSDGLPDLFAQAGQADARTVPLLDERFVFEGQERSVAYGLISELREAAELENNAGCHDVAERYLITNLFSAIREMCKRAFEGHDRAYGALLLDMLGACLGAV